MGVRCTITTTPRLSAGRPGHIFQNSYYTKPHQPPYRPRRWRTHHWSADSCAARVLAEARPGFGLVVGPTPARRRRSPPGAFLPCAWWASLQPNPARPRPPLLPPPGAPPTNTPPSSPSPRPAPLSPPHTVPRASPPCHPAGPAPAEPPWGGSTWRRPPPLAADQLTRPPPGAGSPSDEPGRSATEIQHQPGCLGGLRPLVRGLGRTCLIPGPVRPTGAGETRTTNPPIAQRQTLLPCRPGSPRGGPRHRRRTLRLPCTPPHLYTQPSHPAGNTGPKFTGQDQRLTPGHPPETSPAKTQHTTQPRMIHVQRS